MTYLSNLWNAIVAKPYLKEITVIKTETELKEYPVYIKDPHGIILRDLDRIHRCMNNKPYKMGDSKDLMIYKEAQKDMYNMIKTKIVEAKTYKFGDKT